MAVKTTCKKCGVTLYAVDDQGLVTSEKHKTGCSLGPKKPGDFQLGERVRVRHWTGKIIESHITFIGERSPEHVMLKEEDLDGLINVFHIRELEKVN